MFSSVHFYCGSAKKKVFCYHTKSRDGQSPSFFRGLSVWEGPRKRGSRTSNSAYFAQLHDGIAATGAALGVISGLRWSKVLSEFLGFQQFLTRPFW